MAFILLIASAAVLGRLLLHPLRLRESLENWILCLYAGLSACAVAAVLFGSYSLLLAQTVLAAMAVAGLSAEIFMQRHLPLPRRESAGPPAAYPLWEYAGLFTAAAALFMALIGALAPVTGWDAAVAHLALPLDYGREGRIFFHPGNVYAGYPHLMHTLYAVAAFPETELSASLLSWVFALLACLSVYYLGRRLAGRTAGAVAAGFFAAAPVFMDQAGSVSIDLAFTGYATAALTALLRWFDEGRGHKSCRAVREETDLAGIRCVTRYDFRHRRDWLIISALLAGSACGVRHTGYLVCLFLGAAILFGRSRPRIRGVALFGIVALLAAAPWLLRSWLLTGNPVFPFFLSWMPSRTIEHIAITGAGVHETVSGTGALSIWKLIRFPWDIVMYPGAYDGWTKSPGGMVLILGIPGLIYCGWRVRWAGIYSLAGQAVFFFFQRMARYMLPFFAPMMVVAAAAAEKLAGRGHGWRRVITALLLFSFAWGLALHAAAIHFKLPVVLRQAEPAVWLAGRIERYPAFVYANKYLNDGGVILTVDQRTAWIDPPTFQNHWALRKISAWPLSAQRAWLRRHDIRYIMIPADFLAASGALAPALEPMFDTWREDTRHFRKIKTLHTPRRDGGGDETVEIYRFLPEGEIVP
jgi:4-amino-4-deoxy-L-arabinose transferase-like glycosyltransferase